MSQHKTWHVIKYTMSYIVLEVQRLYKYVNRNRW